jgi:putative transposase
MAKIQLKHEQNAWLSATINVDIRIVLHTRISWHRGRDPAEQFLGELKEKHRVSDAEFHINVIYYLTCLAWTDLSGGFKYIGRATIRNSHRTYTMRIKRFQKIWNSSQAGAERWLTAYTAHYNYKRSYQGLNDQPPLETLKQRRSI